MDEIELGYQIAPEARQLPTQDDMWGAWYRCAELLGERAALDIVLGYLSPTAHLDVLSELHDAIVDALPWDDGDMLPAAAEHIRAAERRLADFSRG